VLHQMTSPKIAALERRPAAERVPDENLVS
jgi:hypothetical protein